MDSKDLHFVALNKALASIDTKYIINMDHHLTQYDGLPTLLAKDPINKVSLEYLKHPCFWCHAKNLDALAIMLQHPDIHCFSHQNDDFTLTSRGFIWTYPNKPLPPPCQSGMRTSRRSKTPLGSVVILSVVTEIALKPCRRFGPRGREPGL